MVKKTRISFTTEVREVLTLRLAAESTRSGRCPACGLTANMLTLDRVVTLFGTNTRIVMRLVESGSIPFYEAPDGHLLFCSDCVSVMFCDRQT